ncbi:hypothetical protein Tco_0808882 [Tanacetum coccineum]
MSLFNQLNCFGCGEPIDDLRCRWCTCERCGYDLRDGFCLFCNSRDGNSFAYDPNLNSFDDSQNLSDYPPQSQYQTYSCELCGNDAHYCYDCPPKVLFGELAEYINSSSWNRPAFYDDDDDDEYTIQYREYLENSSNAIAPVLLIEEPDNSLMMISLPLVFLKENPCFSNPFFDSNDDFTSSDNDSLSDEDVLEDVTIYSNPLFEFNDEYISSDVNPLFDEVLEDIECKDSYDSNLDESTLLVTPLSDSNEDECLTPSDDIELLLHHDPSINVVSILEGFTDEPPLKENDDLFDLESKENDWKKILYDAPIDDLITEDKVFDPEIHEIIFSPTYVNLSFVDRHYLSFTYVIRTFLPYFTYPVNSPFPLSFGSEDIIFDLGISAFRFSSLKPVAYECPMEDCPDYEDSHARGFVPRSLDLQSLACLFMGIRYPRSY